MSRVSLGDRIEALSRAGAELIDADPADVARPDPGPVLAGRDDELAVRAEGGVVDLVVVALQSPQQAARLGIPQASSAVVAGCNHPLPVGAEGRALDRAFMAAERAEAATARN